MIFLVKEDVTDVHNRDRSTALLYGNSNSVSALINRLAKEPCSLAVTEVARFVLLRKVAYAGRCFVIT